MNRAEEVARQFDQLRANTAHLPTRDLEPPCRCGWADTAPLGTPPVRVPVVDLVDADGYMTLETSPAQRTCKACTHPIHPGQAAVVHRLGYSAGVFNRYHPECVDIS